MIFVGVDMQLRYCPVLNRPLLRAGLPKLVHHRLPGYLLPGCIRARFSIGHLTARFHQRQADSLADPLIGVHTCEPVYRILIPSAGLLVVCPSVFQWPQQQQDLPLVAPPFHGYSGLLPPGLILPQPLILLFVIGAHELQRRLGDPRAEKCLGCRYVCLLS